MNCSDIRQKFLTFFQDKEHNLVSSSPLVPDNDPTLLFTNAGMVQFKDTFLGEEQRPYQRATSSQKCVRAGGKHNDLENVGHTARHHTFFEMLGNFSFGDYFKREAIQYAWDFLTKELGLPEEKLWITVYKDDPEAADIWLKEMKVSADRFSYCDEKDNFWSMGDVGPCGPCSEIFYDHGESIPGGPPGSPEEDGDRYVEIWNLVFMQFNRDAEGQLTQLPKPSVDTGMGLERIAAVLQNVHSNYDIDIFQHLIKSAATYTHTDVLSHNSLKVIADHIRSCSFLICEGILPSNEGRGYVLRRIIRRAIRHGILLGQKDPFFSRIVSALVDTMGDAYPELKEQQAHIEATLLKEEQQFSQTLSQGLTMLDGSIESLQNHTLPGNLLFKLYDTYGFPIDLIKDIAKDKKLELDMNGFEREMEQQRSRARSANQFKLEQTTQLPEGFSQNSTFVGYQRTSNVSKVDAIIVDGQQQDSLSEGQEACIVLSETPFYAESGGQIGDSGTIETEQFKFVVEDTQKKSDTILHIGQLESGTLNAGEQVNAQVDEVRRHKIILNHSATHILHAALRQVLGAQVVQKGSLVHPDYLRFDFSHDKPITQCELQTIEDLVNHQILNNIPANTDEMSLEDAKQSGALGLFEDKYGDTVRVLSIGEFSKELCGGTHVQNSGDIGLFKITSESGIASGIRRVEAITGHTARHYLIHQANQLNVASGLLKTDANNLVTKLEQLLQSHKSLEKELEQLKSQNALSSIDNVLKQVEIIDDVQVLATEVESADIKTLRDMADKMKHKLSNGIVLLATQQDNKIQCIASISKTLTKQYHAGKLMQFFTQQIDGKGGGRADMAQGGGNNATHLPEALKSVVGWVRENS